MLSSLNISSRITLQDGNSMPLFGLGVWAAQSGKENYEAVLSALKAGYRLSTLQKCMEMKKMLLLSLTIRV